ncbi:MAG: alpha/beta hydrolase [Caldilineaceae bacterium]|nr:alpha/beta hydrolase [Caldilineaceae bacterium]
MPTFTHDNVQLFYREQGSGPLLLILPGNTASSALHEGELAYFGQRFHAVSLDFRGTGQSDRLDEWPVDWYETAAHDVAALIDHLGEGQATVMGTSGGAIVALLLAIHHPDKVRGVIADSTVEPFTRQMLNKNVIQDRARREPAAIEFWTQAHGDDWEAVIDADTDMLKRFVRKSRGRWSRGRLNEIACPVLLTASLEDSVLANVGRQVTRMSRQIPDSRAYFSGDGDHPLMWSRAEEFRQVCDYFLARLYA